MVARALIRIAIALLSILGLAPLHATALAFADTSLTTADGRTLPVRIMWSGESPLPLLVLSHGANGTLDGLQFLQRQLTIDRVVVAPQHLDSESNPDLAKVDRATLFAARIADMRAVLDAIPQIEAVIKRRIDRKRISAGGHSFGALIAQALGGARVGLPAQDWRDARVTRVVAFSPPGPIPNYATAEGWAAMAVPQFVQTGTDDVVPMIAPKWEAHLASFEAASVPGSVLWVGVGVDHYFGNRIQRLGRTAPDQSAAFDAASALADAFLAGRPLAVPPALTERLVRK